MRTRNKYLLLTVCIILGLFMTGCAQQTSKPIQTPGNTTSSECPPGTHVSYSDLRHYFPECIWDEFE